MRGLVLSVLVVVAMASPAFAAEPIQTPVVANGFKLTVSEQSVLDSVNAERAKRGLHALVADPILTVRARSHSIWMASRRSMTHSNAWENIAYGQRTPLAVFRTWLNSSGHRANMMSRSATKIGIGVAPSSYGSLYWTQQFGKTTAPTAGEVCTKESCQQGNCSESSNGRSRGRLFGRLLQRRR